MCPNENIYLNAYDCFVNKNTLNYDIECVVNFSLAKVPATVNVMI